MTRQGSSRFGLGSIVLLGLNGVIGSGIFLLPGKAMALMGPGSLFVYVFMTLVVLAVALCFAECAGRFERNGAAYVYAKEAFGPFVGFEVGLLSWAIRIIAWAAMAMGFVTALATLWPPALQEPWRSTLVVTLLLGLGLLNARGVKPTKIVNNLVTLGKLFPLLIFVLVGAWFIKGSHFDPMFPKGFQLDAFGTAALTIFYAFTGFEALAVGAEDMENPRRNLPRALLIVMIACSGIYCLVQAIAVGTLGADLATSTAPLADAATTFMGPTGKWLVALGTLVSIGGINVAASFGAPRTGLALAEDGVVPRKLAELNRFGTPYLSILVTVALAIPVALSGSFVQLATISMVSRFAQYLPTCLAVLVLRRRSDLPEGFRIPFGPLVPLLASIICIWLLSKATKPQLLWGLGALVLGLPVYVLMQHLRSRAESPTESPNPQEVQP